MYTRQVAVRLRSTAPLAVSPRPKPATDEEGPKPNFPAMTSAEGADAVQAAEAGLVANGSWTSKLGNAEDIEHHTVDGVSGPHPYGFVAKFMRRNRKR